jgi:hypothetical protein
MKRKKVTEAFQYLDVDWNRTFKPKWSDSAVELTFYKGKVLVSVPYGTARAKALQEQTGFVVAGSAWLHAKDIDGLIKLLREGRRVYMQHQRDALKVANCDDCRKIFGGVCDRHRPLFKKYGKKKSPPRGLR